VNARYSEMMERMPWPVLLINDNKLIYMFNSAAQKLFGFAHPSEKGMHLEELPLDNKARQAMLRCHRLVIYSRKQYNLKNFHLVTNRFDGFADVHFTPLSTETGNGVIVMFQVARQNKSVRKKSGGKKPAAKKQAVKKSSAKEKSSSKKTSRNKK